MDFNMEQKSLEQYFQEHGITDSDTKVKILNEITDLVYDRNMHVVRLEKIDDEYVKKQTLEGIKELEDKIERIFKKYKNG
jgi:ribulose bisphosphate carboxylase small subunit